MVVVWCVNDILHGQHRENARRTAESVTQDAMSRPSGFFGLIIVIGPYRIEISNIDIVSISYRISNVFSTVSYRIDFQFENSSIYNTTHNTQYTAVPPPPVHLTTEKLILEPRLGLRTAVSPINIYLVYIYIHTWSYWFLLLHTRTTST